MLELAERAGLGDGAGALAAEGNGALKADAVFWVGAAGPIAAGTGTAGAFTIGEAELEL